MPNHFTYLLIDLLCIFFPLVASFHPKIRFYRQWRYFAGPCILTASVFIVWDVIFTNSGVWSFNPAYVTGAYFLGLPLEEYLFFLCIPYACMFTYYCVDHFMAIPKNSGAAKFLSFALIGCLTTTALYHLSALYTSVTFLAVAALLIYLAVVKQVPYLATFYISFLIILLPFFLSNGVLTGTGLAAPVVSYNDRYNLGIRMATIPLEDTFYGMMLFLMNVSGFEYLRKKAGKNI